MCRLANDPLTRVEPNEPRAPKSPIKSLSSSRFFISFLPSSCVLFFFFLLLALLFQGRRRQLPREPGLSSHLVFASPFHNSIINFCITLFKPCWHSQPHKSPPLSLSVVSPLVALLHNLLLTGGRTQRTENNSQPSSTSPPPPLSAHNCPSDKDRPIYRGLCVSHLMPQSNRTDSLWRR